MEAAVADSSRPHQIRPAAPVRVLATICPGGTGSIQIAARAVDFSAVVSILPGHDDNTSRPGAQTPRKDHGYRLDGFYPYPMVDDHSSSVKEKQSSFQQKEDDRSSVEEKQNAGSSVKEKQNAGSSVEEKQDDSCNQIFQAEVKPLVDAIFRGTNSCVIACGSSAKTHLIMGLLSEAMEQISETSGFAVSVSSYQVLQDAHVFDILEPKDSEVLVLEDANGRTHLKGLSRVRVKSTQEFEDLCCCGTNMLKHPAKPSNNMQPTDGHRGFIIYISSFDQQGKECVVAKMNFLYLAGYGDPKQKTNGRPNCNRSTYALMNVVQALNSNQSFIPYRQSKLTRILQDSLCKTNKAVLIACLDEFSSQDAISTLSLTSRSSQVVSEQCYNLSLSASAKNLSRSLLPSIRQPSSALDKYSRPQLNNSAVKASQTRVAEKRSQVTMHSTKKTVSSLSTCTKQRGVKSALSGRKLFCPSTNVSKENKIVYGSEVTKAEELQSSLGMENQDSVPDKGCDETERVIELVPCSMQKSVLSSMQEEDSLSGLHVVHSCTNLEDMTAEKTPVSATQFSPKLTDQLREISNSLKLLNSMPIGIKKQEPVMVGAQYTHTDLPEPKTPAIHLKFGHVEDSHELLKARSTGVKKTLAKECLMFLNSANKEQLKSLKGIGEKRANRILEVREESPEPFKEIDDLRTIIRMNNKEIKTLMSGMVMDMDL